MVHIFKNETITKEEEEFFTSNKIDINYIDLDVDEGLENLNMNTSATEKECKEEILHRFNIITYYHSGFAYYKHQFEKNNSLICFVQDEYNMVRAVDLRDKGCRSVAGFNGKYILDKIQNAEKEFNFKVYMCILQNLSGDYNLSMFYVEKSKCDWRIQRRALASRTPYVYVENLKYPQYSEGGKIGYGVVEQGIYRTDPLSLDYALVEGLEQNQDFYELLLNNEEIKRSVLGIFTEEVYESLKKAFKTSTMSLYDEYKDSEAVAADPRAEYKAKK